MTPVVHNFHHTEDDVELPYDNKKTVEIHKAAKTRPDRPA
jgi:hypothetical protein